MANQTVYPYGTEGTLPSSIGIINDLTTGGADKALSAEQGKVIGGYLGEHLEDKFVSVSLPSASDFSLGANTATTNRWTNTTAKHIALPVNPGEIYKLEITAGAGNFYGLFTDYVVPTENSSSVYYKSGEGRLELQASSEILLTIPTGISYLIITTVNGSGYSSTWSVKKKVQPSIDDDFVAKDEIVNNTTDGGADKALSAEMGKRLANEANKVIINEDEELPSASYAFYLHANGIWRTGGIHKAIQVTPGQKIRLRTLNSSNGEGNFYAWLTSSYSPPPTDWDTIPYVSGTNRIFITDASGWNTLTVPNTAAYLIIELKTGAGDTSEWQLQSLTEMGTSEAFEQFVISGGGSNIPADLPKYGYDGPRVSTEERHFVATGKVSTITSVSCQGGACFGDYLFMFTEYNTTCWMYNLASETLVQTIEIPSEERGFVGQCHCNTVNFGTEKYDADDPFPLIYVSTGYAAGGYSGALAYRIVATTEDDVTTYSLTLVQTIKFPGSGWTEFITGEDGFCFVWTDTGNTLYKMIMPKLSDGDVTFDFSNALAVYRFPPQPSWFGGSRNQNRLYHNGKIYLVSGVPGGSEALLFIVLDLATERREVVIDLKNTLGLASEPETVFIWEGHFCVAFRTNANVYALYFD